MKLAVMKLWPGPNARSARRTAAVHVTPERDETAHIAQYGRRYIAEVLALLPGERRDEPWAAEGPPFKTPAEFLCELMILLQRLMGYPVSEHAVSPHHLLDPSAKDAIAHVEFAQASAFFAALRLAAEAIMRAGELSGTSFREGFAPALLAVAGNQLREPSGEARYVRAAMARGIPYAQAVLHPSVLVFGQGVRRRQSWRNFSDRTGHIATVVSTNKIATNQLLADAGLPVPRQIVAKEVEEAVTALTRFGKPVVVKPHNQDYGTAVFPHLESEAEVRQAFSAAARHGTVIVEQHIAGDHHRLMVINGRFISARVQRPAHIVGTGRETIADIVARTNAERLAKGWHAVPSDTEAAALLVRQGYGWSSVPEAGRIVYLRRQGNLSTGGSMEVCTDRVHPENRAMAERAAGVLGIDIAGVDFITPDIGRSFVDGVGAICEVNVTPGFIFDENRLVLNEWFPDGDTGRIPVIGVLGDSDGHHLEVCLAAALSQRTGGKVALAVNGSVFLDGLRIARAEGEASPERIILLGSAASAAVLALPPNDWTKRGVELDRLDILLLRAPLLPAASAAAEIAKRIATVTISAEEGTAAAAEAPCPVCGSTLSEQDRSLLCEALSRLSATATIERSS